MPEITVNTTLSYPVKIERGIILHLGEAMEPLLPPCRVALLTDDITASLFGAKALRSLEGAGYDVSVITIPHGEENKDWDTLGDILEELAEAGLTHSDALLALGGGMVSDLGGLAAALYRRGIAFFAAATTLLAALDATVGGKTAVNLASGKNLAGVIRQPSGVFCDPDVLDALPETLRRDGMAEAIKMGVLGAEGVWGLIAQPKPDLEALVAACVAYKAAVVEQDAEDTGIRRSLNLGHTFGHAIEKRSGYTLTHGQAVSIGLAIITRAARTRGACDSISAERILTALRRHSLPTRCPYPAEELLEFALQDKKREGDEIAVVLPNAIGFCSLRKYSPRELGELLRQGLE